MVTIMSYKKITIGRNKKYNGLKVRIKNYNKKNRN